MTTYDRDTTWTTADGRKIPIRCMSDVHLANTIDHIRNSVFSKHYSPMLLEAMLREAKDRGLTESFLARAPIPWQDVDGKIKLGVDPRTGEYPVVGR